MSGLFSLIYNGLKNAECKVDLEEMAPAQTALGIFLWIVTAASVMPSITKPIKLKSTEGMSPGTLLLTNIQQTLTVVNTVLMKSPQMKQCGTHPWGCQATVITLYQTVTAWILLFFVFPTVVWYPCPNDEKTRARNLKWWRAQQVICFGLVGITSLWALVADCPQQLAMVGKLFGYASSILMIFRFAPQLKTSCVTKTAGSISYITYVVIGIGGFAMTYFQIFASKEHITTWLPVFVGNCFQTAIVLTCAFYDYGPGKRLKPLPAGKGFDDICDATGECEQGKQGETAETGDCEAEQGS